MPTSTIFLNNPVIVEKIFLLKLRLLFLYDSIIMVVYVKWTNPWNNTSIIYGITLDVPKRECIRGIPRATEFPKQAERPKSALSSVLYLNNKLPIWKPIMKTRIPPPKNETNNKMVFILGNSICQK